MNTDDVVDSLIKSIDVLCKEREMTNSQAYAYKAGALETIVRTLLRGGNARMHMSVASFTEHYDMLTAGIRAIENGIEPIGVDAGDCNVR